MLGEVGLQSVLKKRAFFESVFHIMVELCFP